MIAASLRQIYCFIAARTGRLVPCRLGSPPGQALHLLRRRVRRVGRISCLSQHEPVNRSLAKLLVAAACVRRVGRHCRLSQHEPVDSCRAFAGRAACRSACGRRVCRLCCTSQHELIDSCHAGLAVRWPSCSAYRRIAGRMHRFIAARAGLLVPCRLFRSLANLLCRGGGRSPQHEPTRAVQAWPLLSPTCSC